jgi:hypothetical protein
MEKFFDELDILLSRSSGKLTTGIGIATAMGFTLLAQGSIAPDSFWGLSIAVLVGVQGYLTNKKPR